jgi:hypothetical protein
MTIKYSQWRAWPKALLLRIHGGDNCARVGLEKKKAKYGGEGVPERSPEILPDMPAFKIKTGTASLAVTGSPMQCSSMTKPGHHCTTLHCRAPCDKGE